MVRDSFVLFKPRVMSLVIFTGLAGMVAAPGEPGSGTDDHRDRMSFPLRWRLGSAEHVV